MDNEYGHGVAIKKVTNVFSKKILAKRALREIKLLRHFIGHDNVSSHTQVTRVWRRAVPMCASFLTPPI